MLKMFQQKVQRVVRSSKCAPMSRADHLHITEMHLVQTMASPSKAGQQALQALPSKSSTNKRKISLYKLPDTLLQDRSVMKESDETGLPVLKVDKVIFHTCLVLLNVLLKPLDYTVTKSRSFREASYAAFYSLPFSFRLFLLNNFFFYSLRVVRNLSTSSLSF